MPGCSRMPSTTSRPPFTRFTTPGGRSSESSTSNAICWVSGTCSDGLRMNALPQAIAKGRNQNGTIAGKLNGTIAAQTPTGWRTVSASTLRATSSMIRPCIVVGTAQAASTISIMRATSARASPIVLPISVVTDCASSSRRASRPSRSANSRRPRSITLTAATRAARRARRRTAASRSAAFESGTLRQRLAGGGVGHVEALARRGRRPARRRRSCRALASPRGARWPWRSRYPLDRSATALAEQVLRGRASERGGAGPVVRGHEALEPAHQHRGLRASPWRAPGRRRRPRSRATAIAVTCSASPCGVQPAASSRRAARARGADGHVRLAEPPGAAEGVRDHEHGRPDAARRRHPGAQPPGGAVRVVRQQHHLVSPGTFERSTPALAHTKPWRVTHTSTPRSARSTSADSSSTTCTSRGSLPCSRAKRAARARRRARPRGRGSGPRPWTRPCAPPRARRRRPGRPGRPPPAGRPRSSPGRTSGSGRRARRRRGSGRHPRAARSAARVARRRACRALGERLDQRGRGRRPCPRRAGAWRALHEQLAPAAPRRQVPLEAARAEARRDRVRRVEQQRVGARAVAVGHDRDGGRRLPRRAARPPRGVEQRRVAGHEQRPLEAGGQRMPRSRSAPPADWPCALGVLQDLGARRRARSSRGRGSAVTTAIASERRHARQGGAARRPPSPRPASGAGQAGAPATSRCLAAPKVLTGRIARVFIGPATVQAQRGAQARARSPPPGAGPPAVSMSVSILSEGRPVTSSSATIPSSSPS